MQEETIRIIVEDTQQAIITEGSKSAIDTGGQFWIEEEELEIDISKTKVADVKVEKLEKEMLRLLDVVERISARPETQNHRKSGMQLDEIELSVEINAEGQISIIGNGAKAGAKGAIKLKFKRSEIK
ncbi:MAG: hypothetical protein KME28_28140 [Pelatocladus maniniholoensis HA4357-MV3]|jgi:hypothetical protein|uniref:Pepco domain-containing protein n=1 Tax=Pelatocladus maniniholoensis HA4357-MV3 TaxID=1117104 RepID=A0A9E3HFY3_9NOST|nr:hypothetical protein [Pelatocladus maniniholoensis HA4357-MV3]BAZ67296.1 hypothetical protein NIES4106_20510 [Fischerella sp. NIES-4106]